MTVPAPTRYLYFAHDGRPRERVKIGISIRPHWRVKTLHCELLFAVPCEHSFARTLEHELHKEFSESRLYDRCFYEGSTEWFAVTDRVSRLIQAVRLMRRWPFDGTEVIL